MRLTDRPRTLAEMRPDLPWPDALQAVLDKALARDVNERYQSAAQFGRDFAAAVAEMPATQATEGATMVIGAQGAPKGAATKPVPATRVAERDESRAPAKSAPKGPAPAETKKSPLAPILAGVAVVAVAGYFGVKQFTAQASPTGGDTTGVVQTPPTSPDTGGRQASPGGTGTDPQPGPTNPGTTPPRTDKSTAPVPPPTTPTAPTVNVPAKLAEWLKEVLDNFEDRPLARRVLQDLDGVKAGLVGRQLGEWHFVEMHAFMVLGDTQSCRAARDVKRLLTDPARIAVADQALQDPTCNP